ncbi:Uncharacterised protein [Segatella copri]|nr:Uncharacterised protein [Segatella copri]
MAAAHLVQFADGFGKCLGIHGESVTITAIFQDTDMIGWDARQCRLLHLNW